jgi:hypothetical protein
VVGRIRYIENPNGLIGMLLRYSIFYTILRNVHFCYHKIPPLELIFTYLKSSPCHENLLQEVSGALHFLALEALFPGRTPHSKSGRCGKEKISCPCSKRNLDSSVIQLVAGRYTD